MIKRMVAAIAAIIAIAAYTVTTELYVSKKVNETAISLLSEDLERVNSMWHDLSMKRWLSADKNYIFAVDAAIREYEASFKSGNEDFEARKETAISLLHAYSESRRINLDNLL